MHPVLFSIGRLKVYSYGTFVAISFLVSLWIFYLLARKEKLWQKDTLNYLLLTMIFVLAFARLSFFLAYLSDFYSHWYQIFYLWQGGLVSYGGIFGMILGFIIFFRKNLWQYLDILAICVLFGGIFWRIGGILAGNYPTSGNIHFLFFTGQFPAVQLEIIFLALGFGLFLYLYNKKILSDNKIFFLVSIYYGLIRLVLDYWRQYPHGILILNIGQWFGVVLIALGVIGLICSWYNPYKSQTKASRH
jgi:phosphatidylglycerol:prolipoprotein diacylglycerol transferase